MIQKPQPPLRNPEMSKQSPKPRSQNGKKLTNPFQLQPKKPHPPLINLKRAKKKKTKDCKTRNHKNGGSSHTHLRTNQRNTDPEVKNSFE